MFKCEVIDFLTRAGIVFKEDRNIYDNDDLDLAHDWPASYVPITIGRNGGVELWFDPGDHDLLGVYEPEFNEFTWKK